jgi:acetylornithine deacetylase
MMDATTAGSLSEGALIGWLQRFVRHPSQQGALHERDPQVLSFIRDCVAPLLADVGAPFRYDPMGNLIVELGPQDGGRSLLFVAYAMTHPANRMTDPFAATLIDTPRGTAVRGRGVAEQKTALAAALGALGATLAGGRKLGGRLTFALTTAGETGRHDAIASVMRELKTDPRFVIICIGTGNRVAVGNKGRVDFDVVVGGKAAHSSAPWNGVNAIAGARRVLERTEGLDLNVANHPTFGPATLTPTAIESAPKATHTVPDTVRLTFDRRLLPGEDPDAAYEAIRRAIVLEPPWTLACTRGPVMYPNEITLDGPLFSRLRAAFARAGQGAPEPFYCNFALDAGYFGRKGIEAVMLGPGEVDQFHSDEEQVLVADLVAMAHVYHRIIEQCLAPNA